MIKLYLDKTLYLDENYEKIKERCGEGMIYVIYVGSGNESRAEKYIEEYVSGDLYEECFHPVRQLKKKVGGKWVDYYQKLIPGYVFVKSENIDEFREVAAKLPIYLGLLGVEEGEDYVAFQALSEAEESWLFQLAGKTMIDEKPSYVAGVSQVGFDENDQVIILDGPLKSMQGQIKKLNLHKRYAEVEIDFMGQKTVFHLGIELIVKVDEGKES